MVILDGMGFDVYGIDVSQEMASNAVSNYPQLEGRIKCASLPSDELYFNMKFDGILCSAVLMHITDDRLFDAAFCIRNNLKENGRLLISVPVERDDLDSEGRAPDGRIFIMRSFDYYTLLFERLGFKLIGYYEEGDGLGRAGVKWGVGVFEACLER
jgi:2-polyprenyl-3-methyl-5-hydroxy-6-metoxy-1,4-benzoquinol methylase